MAFPAVQSITATVFSSDATAHLVNMPATVNAGDLLLTLFANDSTAAVTTPSGWTSITSQSFAQRTGIYAKIANGTEGGTTVDFVTSTAETAAAQVYRITGTFGGVTSSDIAQNRDTGSGTTANSLSLDPAGWGVEDTLWITVVGYSDQITGVTTYPTNYTNGTYSQSGSTNTHVQFASARRELSAASEDPGAFTFTGSDAQGWQAFTIAIRPAVVSVPKSFSDAGAEGAESFSKAVQVSKAFSDAGAEGAESFQLAKLKSFSDAGAEGSESYHLTKMKSFSDTGASGTETFSKTKVITPVYLKDKFEAVIIKILDS